MIGWAGAMFVAPGVGVPDGTVGVAADILRASVECIIDGLEWKLRGEHKH